MAKSSEKQANGPKKQMITRTYQYRIYPTAKQTRVLCTWLRCCGELYNAALDERKSAYRMAGVSLSYEHQCAELPACKEVRPELGGVSSQVLQDAVKRVDRAFEDFFRRVENRGPRISPLSISFTL